MPKVVPDLSDPASIVSVIALGTAGAALAGAAAVRRVKEDERS